MHQNFNFEACAFGVIALQKYGPTFGIKATSPAVLRAIGFQQSQIFALKLKKNHDWRNENTQIIFCYLSSFKNRSNKFIKTALIVEKNASRVQFCAHSASIICASAIREGAGEKVLSDRGDLRRLAGGRRRMQLAPRQAALARLPMLLLQSVYAVRRIRCKNAV